MATLHDRAVGDIRQNLAGAADALAVDDVEFHFTEGRASLF